MTLLSHRSLDDVGTTTLACGVITASLLLLAIVFHDRPPGVGTRKSTQAITPAYPLVGNLPWILAIINKRTRILDEALRLQRQQAHGGRPFTLTFPALGGRVTVINNPAYIQHVQKTNFDNYPKGPDQQRIMSDVLGTHGIFCSDGDVWLKQRKLAANIFSFNNFRTHVQSTVVKEIDVLHTLLCDAADRKAAVNFPDVMFRFTLNSFALMAFDADVDCLPERVEGLAIPNSFAQNFDYAQMVMDHRIFALLPKWCEVFTNEGRQMKRCMGELNTYCYRIIDSRFQRREKGSETATDKGGKDLLELFMDRGLTRNELLPVILNFLIAGRDTTAQSLAWLFYELWKSPEYIAKIRESIVPLLGTPDDQRTLQYEELKELPFLQACFYEAVRLWPAVPKNLKRVVRDDVIRPVGTNLQDVEVKAGESVLWSDWAMARMPEVWGADCERFRPERFLETDKATGRQSVKEFSPFLFHSFNAGPRMCLGKTLATYEGVAVAAEILGRFDVHFDDHAMRTSPPTYGDSLTLPCSPYALRFSRRE